MRMLGFYRGKVKFVNINVDENPELAKKLKITTIPTTLLYKNGDHVGTVTGPNVNELIQKMNVMLAEDAAPAQGAAPGRMSRLHPAGAGDAGSSRGPGNPAKEPQQEGPITMIGPFLFDLLQGLPCLSTGGGRVALTWGDSGHTVGMQIRLTTWSIGSRALRASSWQPLRAAS